jgi:hypothetical protein
MNRKTLAAAVAVPLLLGVSAADAAPKKKKPAPPKPVCNLVTDAKGDATDTGGTGAKAPNDPNLDIVSADIASDATRLTAVIRLDKLDDSENSSHLGRSYVVSFGAFGKTVSVRAITSPAGDSWHGGAGTGTVDKAKKEIRITVPLAKLSEEAKLPQPLKSGIKVTSLTATSWRWVANTQATLGIADRAAGAGPGYTLGYPSCVKVGA